jgi:hypothetical protein
VGQGLAAADIAARLEAGYPIGSLFGIMIYGVIFKFISFNGNLSSRRREIMVLPASGNERLLKRKTQGGT